jgi:hypothetical protein
MGNGTLLGVIVGLGLSAACGFRIFVPLLVMSIASLSGHLALSPGFEWIGTYPALAAFSVATILEIAGYYIPWVDHLLDIIGAPAAVIAGIIVMASSVSDMSPFLKWSLAIIAGGGVAGTFHAVTAAARGALSAGTAGMGNPALSTLEAGGATLFSVLAIAIPFVAIAAVAVILALTCRMLRGILRRRRSMKPA